MIKVKYDYLALSLFYIIFEKNYCNLNNQKKNKSTIIVKLSNTITNMTLGTLITPFIIIFVVLIYRYF